MRNLALRGVPDEVHEWLDREAERSSRSINGQILHLLRSAYTEHERMLRREARLSAFRERYLPEEGIDLDEVMKSIRAERDRR